MCLFVKLKKVVNTHISLFWKDFIGTINGYLFVSSSEIYIVVLCFSWISNFNLVIWAIYMSVISLELNL